MKKLLGIIVLGLLLSGNAYANVKVLECKQIIEINEDIGEDLIIKHIVKISLDSKSIETSCTTCNNADKTLYEISKDTDESIVARSLAGLSGEQYLELNRYTLELIYHFYSEDSVYQGGSVFECNKLEKKI
jgi:hypothetical protein|tara:strand:+ start:460 stop:852 length:393 start_codon:yes stop_codon:yes gene_type:complete